MKYDTATPYIASYLLLKKDGKVAFLLRTNTSWMNDHYGLVAGKVEKGESFKQAAVREAKEEAGVVVKPENLRVVLTSYRYEAGEEAPYWVDVVFEVTEWEGEVVNAEPHMHSKVEWFSLDDLPSNVIPSLRFMLEKIQAGETYCEYGWEIEETD